MTDSVETLGELGRRLDRHEANMVEQFREVRSACAGILTASVDARVYAIEREARERELTAMREDAAKREAHQAAEIAKLDARLTWVFRAAVSGILLPVIVGILLYALMSRGPT